MNITTPLRRLAVVVPDDVAIIRADGSALTYADLDRAIDRAANRALARGLAAGDTAGLAITGPDEAVGLILALGLARLGIASADPTLSGATMGARFETAADIAVLPPGDDARVPIHPGGGTLCRIFASSGTTGTPKPATIDHALMVRRVASSLLATREGAVRRIIAVNFGITWGFTAMLRTLWQGGTIVLSNSIDAPAAIARHRVTHVMMSPLGVRALLDALPAGAALPGLAVLEVSGSRLPAPLRDAAAARICPHIRIHLGASEAGGIASGPARLLAARPGGVGFVHADVEVEAVDEQDRKLPPGAEGIVRLRSALTIGGYGRPDPKVFRDGWFYPGDIGAVWPDGMLTLAGRVGDLINSGGVKHDPARIEDVLLTHPGVSEAAAFAVPDGVGIDQVWAAIVAPAAIPAAVLKAFCHQRLAGAAPRYVLQMKALPRTRDGKVRKDMLIAFARTQVTPAS